MNKSHLVVAHQIEALSICHQLKRNEQIQQVRSNILPT